MLASPSIIRKSVTPSGTMQSLNNMSAAVEDKPLIVQTTPKSKRATSFIRKKPPLERGLSAQSALRINKNALVGMKYLRLDSLNCNIVLYTFLFIRVFTVDCPSTSGQKDVSILVTEPSPECPNGPSSSSKNRLHTDSVSTLVHVLVHRESEEYQTDFEDGGKYLL